MSNIRKKNKSVYRGEIKIGDLILHCAVNENGTRIISQLSFNQALERRDGGGSRNLPTILDLKCLEPFISKELEGRVKELIAVDEIRGFEASMIPDICDVWLTARDSGVLNHNDKWLITAQKAEIIMRALAKVGIIALIDEATGYQYDRKYDALRMLLQQYVVEEIQKWMKRFPDRFFEQLDRLYEHEKTTSRSRPPYYGTFINNYIYEPIENGMVKAEIDKKNIKEDGTKIGHIHRWLTTDFGINQLTIQIGRVMGVMEISPNLRKFKENIARQKGLAIQPNLFAEE